MQPACGCSFFLSFGLVQVYEIELSHIGKNGRTPDLVCGNKKSIYHVYSIHQNSWRNILLPAGILYIIA